MPVQRVDLHLNMTEGTTVAGDGTLLYYGVELVLTDLEARDEQELADAIEARLVAIAEKFPDLELNFAVTDEEGYG